MDDRPAARPEEPVRVFPADDAARYLATDELVWFHEPTQLSPELALEGIAPEARFAAEVGDPSAADPAAYAGMYGVYPLLLTVPGGPTPPRQVEVAGLTYVGVHPDHRRRGVLRAMMRDHLDRTRAAGTAVSILHCSEPGIYGRYGYGIGGWEHQLILSRGTTLTAPHLDAEAERLTTRTVTITDPGLPDRLRACDQRVAESEVGCLVFPDRVYRRMVRLEGEELREKEPWRVLFATLDGVDVGSAIFRRQHKWEGGRPHGELEVYTLSGGPAARLALLRRLVDFDLTATVKLSKVGHGDPLWHWLEGPREVGGTQLFDNVWVRLVDLPAALASRGYEADCDVVVEVADELLPDNAGSWRVRVRAGSASAEPSADPPAVSLSIAQLGAAWLGWADLSAMRRAGVLREHRAGAVGELGRALRTELPAWCTDSF